MCILQADNIFNNVLIHISAPSGLFLSARIKTEKRQKFQTICLQILHLFQSACIHKIIPGHIRSLKSSKCFLFKILIFYKKFMLRSANAVRNYLAQYHLLFSPAPYFSKCFLGLRLNSFRRKGRECQFIM
jgi:hypothetical protein